MQCDHIIKGKNILTPSGLREGILLIKDGKIIDILPFADSISEDGVITDAGENIIMPGIIDPHVHINEPGRTEWEGFDTATRAAAAGGITSLIEMPLNASPCTTSAESLEIKIAAAKDKLHVHCGFWGGVIPGNENKLDALLSAGAFGLKAFMTHSGIDDFPHSGIKELLFAMDVLKKHDKPLLVHAELDDKFSAGELINHPTSYPSYLQSRPDRWEVQAIDMLISLCREKKARTHIVHLSSAEALPLIQAALDEQLPLSVETAPHYLAIAAEEIPDGGTIYKCAPPIRSSENRDQLWKALKNGWISFIATDHSPAPPSLKEINTGNFINAWGGIAGLQFSLPVVWTEARRRGFNLKNILQWMCERPAQFLGLNTKGKIIKGADADVVIWNAEEQFTVTESNTYHRHKQSPYTGKTLTGVVKHTFVKGKIVFENGDFISLNQGETLLS